MALLVISEPHHRSAVFLTCADGVRAVRFGHHIVAASEHGAANGPAATAGHCDGLCLDFFCSWWLHVDYVSNGSNGRSRRLRITVSLPHASQ
jgi:hypothetical protein